MKYLRIMRVGIAVVSFMAIPVCHAQVSYEEFYLKGLAYAAQGKFTEAEQEFRRGLNTDYPFTTPLISCLGIIKDLNSKKIKSQAAAGLFKGISYIDKKELPKAMAEFSKVIASEPAYAPAYSQRGSLYSLKGMHDQAIVDFNKAIQLSPHYAEVYLKRGATFAIKKMHEKALSDLNQALSLDPRYAEAYCARGNVYAEKENYLEAISDFTKAINLFAKYELAYRGRANAYASVERYNEALLDLNQLILFDPKRASLYFTKAILCEKAGFVGEAKDAYGKFIEYAPFTYMDQINYAQQRIAVLETRVRRRE